MALGDVGYDGGYSGLPSTLQHRMPQMRRSGLAMSVTALVGLGLAACGSDATTATAGSTPIAASSPSISSTPSGTATTQAPPSALPTPSVVAASPSPDQSTSPTTLAQTVKLDINQQFPPDNPGSYSRVTPTFTVSDEWKIAYNFNCDGAQGFGFVVTVYKGDSATQTDMLADDAYNDKGSTVAIEHVGGTFHLTVLTAAGCTWRVVVTG